jgi:hypothetical protein
MNEGDVYAMTTEGPKWIPLETLLKELRRRQMAEWAREMETRREERAKLPWWKRCFS